MHGYMKYTQPLFIQAIMAIKALYDSKVRRADCPPHEPLLILLTPLLDIRALVNRSSRSTSWASLPSMTFSAPSSLPPAS